MAKDTEFTVAIQADAETSPAGWCDESDVFRAERMIALFEEARALISALPESDEFSGPVVPWELTIVDMLSFDEPALPLPNVSPAVRTELLSLDTPGTLESSILDTGPSNANADSGAAGNYATDGLRIIFDQSDEHASMT